MRETVLPVEGLAIYFCFCVFEGVRAIIIHEEAGICLFDGRRLDASLFGEAALLVEDGAIEAHLEPWR